MYAIIEDGGRQFQIEQGQELEIDYREITSGEQVTFDRVLAVRDDSGLKLGTPVLAGATVTAEVIGISQGPKLTVQKFRRRKTYRRKTGHRQMYTKVKINAIQA